MTLKFPLMTCPAAGLLNMEPSQSRVSGYYECQDLKQVIEITNNTAFGLVTFITNDWKKKDKTKVQGVPQSQTAALP